MSAAQNHVDSRDNEIDLSAGNLANPLRKLLLIERDDERNIGDGVLGKTGHACAQNHISRRVAPLQVTCERNTYYGPDATGIYGIALNDQHGTSIAGSRPYRLAQIRPPDLTVVRKNLVTYRRAPGDIRDAARQGSDGHGRHTILRGDGANLDVGVQHW